MDNKDHIKELFQEKLSGMESTVRPELWNGIASQIGAAAPAAAGISVISKIAIGVGVAASLTIIGVYFITQDTKIEKEEKVEALVKENVSTSEEQATQQEVEYPSVSVNESNIESDKKVDSTPSSDKVLFVDDLKDKKVDHKHTDQAQHTPKDQISDDRVDAKEDDRNTETVQDNKENSTSHHEESNVQINADDTKEYGLSLPNVFTPNGDGVHDVLFIDSEGLSDFNLIVLDSQNKVVWMTSDPDFEWNGVGMNGEPVPAGNYVYFITAKDPSGKAFNKSSRLSIIRTR